MIEISKTYVRCNNNSQNSIEVPAFLVKGYTDKNIYVFLNTNTNILNIVQEGFGNIVTEIDHIDEDIVYDESFIKASIGTLLKIVDGVIDFNINNFNISYIISSIYDETSNYDQDLISYFDIRSSFYNITIESLL